MSLAARLSEKKNPTDADVAAARDVIPGPARDKPTGPAPVSAPKYIGVEHKGVAAMLGTDDINAQTGDTVEQPLSSPPRPASRDPDANLPAGVDPLSATGWAPRPSSAPPVAVSDDGALGHADGLENSVLALLAAQLQAERQRAAAAEAKLSKALESTQAMAVRSAIAETKLEAALASNAALEAANAALQK
ncbi:hypothetical protein EMIHUDRAFT_435983 [Emiliania huxleyi CCMP1516]|uniref:Uncharacterized protein n=2 Tax=Emiliania huxleyi TaxID=2903 RepID=A0A0D3J954_EMIH1|nr:hypothetical protein EMIHUDRAFT_435983 [Emiliania huxleyi CCMP1516]EOD20039.1 hypothetical protein EMIHUDRAFT_435983 [Emiliania huxleyi CCMP1516]|eukprot:XP_005772468.1 hypothetical protein EMIHUDRAFT_435983 [Emiliania huxleyi CCMP1516]